MATESILLLPPDDPRIPPLKEVCDRLVQALNDESPVSFSESARVERIRRKGGMARRVAPSATTEGLRMPYRPEVRVRLRVEASLKLTLRHFHRTDWKP